jgi:hypothetical protein
MEGDKVTIENIDRKNKHITLTLDIEETRDLTNLLFHARKVKPEDKELSSSEYDLNANMIMAHSLLKNGMIPEFELGLINKFRKRAEEKRSE